MSNESAVMVKKPVIVLICLFLVFVCFQYFYGGDPKDITPDESFEVLAHRGVHAHFNKEVYDRGTGNEAEHILAPTHDYIENTVESIKAAFDMGATIVEIDVRRTVDDFLVIFHDYDLSGRTNGKGYITDKTLAYLQTLDIGYNYTHDGGRTFPYRGKGIGKMVTLRDILHTFPNRKFLIDHKDRSEETANLLIDIVKTLPVGQQKRIYYYGSDKMFNYTHSEVPTISWLLCNRYNGKRWFKKYIITFGLAGFPEDAKGYVITLPGNYTKYIWKWPYRFIQDIHKSGARFFITVDSEEDAIKYADFPADGIVTDYIEDVGKYFIKR